jgi:hypothetical protein
MHAVLVNNSTTLANYRCVSFVRHDKRCVNIQAVLLYNIVGADLGCGGGNTYILHVCIHIRVFKQYCFTISI